MLDSNINLDKYFRQFTLDNLLYRKWNSTPLEWKTWVDSLNEYEVNCVASTLTFDPIVRAKYDSIRLSKIIARRLLLSK